MSKYIKLITVLFSILILSGSLLNCSNSSQTMTDDTNMVYDSSDISVEDKELCLGEIDKNLNRIIPFEFDLKNSSDSIIVVNKVDVSCNCVKIIDFPKRLVVGQSAKLSGTIDLNNQVGHLRKSIFINYDDTCITVLKIVADVKH